MYTKETKCILPLFIHLPHIEHYYAYFSYVCYSEHCFMIRHAGIKVLIEQVWYNVIKMIHVYRK